MTKNKTENTIDQTIIENTTKEFVKTFGSVEKIMDQFNNKRWFQFCQIGTAYDVFRSCNDKIQSLISECSTVEEVQKSLLENHISCYEDFKFFMKPPKILTAKEEEQAKEEKSKNAKEVEENSLDNKIKDNSTAKAQETYIQIALEYIEEKLSSENKIWFTNKLLELYGKKETEEELKTASK